MQAVSSFTSTIFKQPTCNDLLDWVATALTVLRGRLSHKRRLHGLCCAVNAELLLQLLQLQGQVILQLYRHVRKLYKMHGALLDDICTARLLSRR